MVSSLVFEKFKMIFLNMVLLYGVLSDDDIVIFF